MNEQQRPGLRTRRSIAYETERRVLSIGGLAVTIGLLAYMAVAL
jgi:hypothetical protein